MDYPSMLIGGSILIVCIVILYWWFRTERVFIKSKEQKIEDEQLV